MKKILTILTFVIFPDCQIQAQELGLSIGYGTFSMTDLKKVNTESLNGSTPVELKLTDNFPGYYIYGFGTSFPLSESFLLGGHVSVMSTGSRGTYRDYSGRLNLDQKLSGINIAVIPATVLKKDSKNLFTADVAIGATFTSHQLISQLIIGSVAEKEDLEFKSINFFLEPGLRYRRALGNLFFLSLRVGYNLNAIKGKLYLKEDDNAYLLVEGDPARADWSGFRTEAMVSFRLK